MADRGQFGHKAWLSGYRLDDFKIAREDQPGVPEKLLLVVAITKHFRLPKAYPPNSVVAHRPIIGDAGDVVAPLTIFEDEVAVPTGAVFDPEYSAGPFQNGVVTDGTFPAQHPKKMRGEKRQKKDCEHPDKQADPKLVIPDIVE
ncbi:MAG: hypothetical protein WC250_00660 [Candidatus Paceibacterota bacterium]